MKTISYILLLAILTFLTGVFMAQWWFVALIGFALAIIFKESKSTSFILTFFVVFTVWIVVAIYLDSQNDSILAKRVGELFGGIPSFLLAVISAILGGLAGSLGALTGASLSEAVTTS